MQNQVLSERLKSPPAAVACAHASFRAPSTRNISTFDPFKLPGRFFFGGLRFFSRRHGAPQSWKRGGGGGQNKKEVKRARKEGRNERRRPCCAPRRKHIFIK